MAILKFRIYWEEDDSVYRDIAIRHTQTFLELHQAILKGYEFDNKHQATFYRSNDTWQHGREITLETYDKDYRVPPLQMHEVPVGTEIKNTNQKFRYEYDFKKMWQFLIELIQIEKTENARLTYPAVVRVSGLGPSQYGTKAMVEKRMEAQEEKYDLGKEEMEEGFGREGEEDNTTAEEETTTDDSTAGDDY